METFRTRTHFQDAVNLYVFDKKLRLLTLDALERIEVALRADMPHTLGKQGRLITRSREEFMRHNRTKYGLREAEQDSISSQYSVNHGRVFAT